MIDFKEKLAESLTKATGYILFALVIGGFAFYTNVQSEINVYKEVQKNNNTVHTRLDKSLDKLNLTMDRLDTTLDEIITSFEVYRNKMMYLDADVASNANAITKLSSRMQ